MNNKFEIKDRKTRKVSTGREGVHNLTIPDSMYKNLCNGDLNTINLIRLKHKDSNFNFIVICSIDEYNTLIDIIGKD